MQVTLTRQSESRCLVQVIENNELIFCQVINPFSTVGQDRLIQITKLPLAEILKEVSQVTNDAPIHTFAVTPESEIQSPFTLYVRPLHATTGDVMVITENTPQEAVRKALERHEKLDEKSEPIIQWDKTDRLATLDIDYHTFEMKDRPEWLDLLKLIIQINPQPLVYHISHGRGMKLFYIAQKGFSAEELASCAALNWLQLDGKATAEIKSVTRHPLYPRGELKCGDVTWSGNNCNLSEINKWLGKSTDEAARDEYLSKKGFILNNRYDHKYCPIDPGYVSHGDPVWISDTGVFCHSCEGQGKTFGNVRKAGWVPWSGLLGGVDSRVGIMIRKMCHWSHGEHILKNLYPGMKENVLKLAYRSAMKMMHSPDDPRIDNVFTDKVLIRLPGRWMLDGRTPLQRDIARDMLSLLPCVQYVNRQGKVLVNVGDLAELRHGDNDLGKYGIFDLKPVKGTKIWGQFIDYASGNVPFVTQNGKYKDKQPKYVPARKRMDICKAWELMSRTYPKINRSYIELLIAAKGIAEGDADHPMIVVSGPGGSGKTFSVDIAAAICGDAVGDVTWTSNTERLRQSILTELDNKDFIRIDEVFKCGERERRTPRESLDPILNFTQDSVSHKMYVGPVRLGKKFPLVITDIVTPSDVQQDIQLARRLTYVRLNTRVPDWKKSSMEAGIAGDINIRNRSKEYSDACDAILSDVIDRFFTSHVHWDDIITSLGYEKLEHSSDFDNPKEMLKSFFDELCNSNNIDAATSQFPPNQGWKKVYRDFKDNDVLSQLWSELADNQGDKWGQSRRCSEVDWGMIIGVDEAIILDIRKGRQGSLYMRFRVGEFREPLAVNGDIRNVNSKQMG